MRIPFTDSISRIVRGLLPTEWQWSPSGPQGRPYPWERSYPDGLDWETEFPPRAPTALFDEAVAEFAEQHCLNFRGRRYSYSEIARLVDRAAEGFHKMGVKKGIKVGLMLPNSPYAVVCFYAVLKAGGTVVNINPLYAEIGIARLVADSSVRILVTLNVKTLYSKAAPLLEGAQQIEKLVVCSMAGVLPFLEKALFTLLKRHEVSNIPNDDRHLTFEKLIDNDGEYEPVDIDPERDIAVLQYTGGTTGTPKGARLTHANLSANTAQTVMWGTTLRRGEEKVLGVLPLFHAFGMTAAMNLSLAIGAELILLPHFKPADVLKAIAREKATVIIGVPTMYSALIAAQRKEAQDLSNLRFCISGGAPLPAKVQRDFVEASGCDLLEGYGLSEAAPVCTVNPVTGENKTGSVGLPLPGTVVEIVSLGNPDRFLAQGERGEICISGPQVMEGYANRAQDNKDVFRGRRLRTGDVGYLDEDGYLFIVDRIKELILSGGYNVYPRMVEDAIYLHEAVEEVAVCGVPDAHRGETVKAFVRLCEDATLTAGELRAFLKDKLAPFEIPRQVEFRDSLPKTLIGKIDKRELTAAKEPATAET